MRTTRAALLLLAATAFGADPDLRAQDAPGSGGFVAGEPLATTPNTRVYGSFYFTESCSYDPERDVYVAPSLGIRGEDGGNDGYVSLINPDGSVHTLKWIGQTRDGLTLEDPMGSDVANGRFYVVDRNVVRWFDLRTGRPLGSAEVEGASGFNDLEVAPDGTVYMSQTGSEDGSVPQRIYKLDPDGRASVFVDGAPLDRPNGVAFDPDGNIVVVNIASADVLTFSPDGQLIRTEQSLVPGNDGLVVLEDGTKYVSSVREGTVARIPPGGEPELVASGIPSAASMCYDPRRERLVVPMNSWFALAFVELSQGS
ncbi:MAG TPA: SMP-30/gluconolactonase/LRE family protein [Longimicrobiales bacterium]|nr:SMP-30/gluconolactonase/LRE family protein [Longimicrobiales bacterium]